MSEGLIVILFSIGAVAFFMVGLSITLIFKGHFMDSEISTNKNMQALNIRCAVQDTRSEDGSVDCHDAGCRSNCAGCDIDHEEYNKQKQR